MIKEQDLLKRNLYLLLNYYNILPEDYITRFKIDHHLQDIYDFFDGRVLPNKTNLNRASRLLNMSVSDLKRFRNLIPVILNDYLKRWHMSFDKFADDTQPNQIKSKAQNRARLKAIMKHSNLKDATYTKQQYKYIADVLGVGQREAHKLASFRFYQHPSHLYQTQYPRLRQIMLLHLRNIKVDIKSVSWDLDGNHPREDFYNMRSLHYDLKELYHMSQIVSDATSALEAGRCVELFKHMMVFRPNSSYAYKAYLNNYLHLIEINDAVQTLVARYSSRRVYNYARSKKFSLIAGMHADGLNDEARIQYIVYGLHKDQHTPLGLTSLKTYTITTPGLATLDPGWRRLTYQDGMGDYFHTSIRKTNDYIKDCTLSRHEVRQIINFLHRQGLPSVKILPCNKIDWWLNCHNAEYREKGDENL